MKKVLIIIGIVVLALALAIGGLYFFASSKQDSQLKALNVSDVDMQTVADGCYTGISETDLVKVTVEVTVADHKITDIKIVRHDNGKGAPAEAIVSDMISENRCDVDIVTGATGSSVVIKSAVHNALTEGIE